jgi:hypothetical protein
MSDRTPAKINIGGKIREADLPKLIRAIGFDGAGFEWGERTNIDPNAVNLKEQVEVLVKKGSLDVLDTQATRGEFPEIERVCQELKLDFTRYSDAGDEYEAEVIDYRKGWKFPRFSDSNNDGEKNVSNSTAKRILSLIQKKKFALAEKKLLKAISIIPLRAFKIV